MRVVQVYVRTRSKSPHRGGYHSSGFRPKAIFHMTFDRNKWISTFGVASIVFDYLASNLAVFDHYEVFFDPCALI